MSYPVLLRFRSPRPLTSWVVALLAVLDAAALQASVAPRSTPVAARLLLRMGFVCLRRLAATVGLTVDEDPHPDGPLEPERPSDPNGPRLTDLPREPA